MHSQEQTPVPPVQRWADFYGGPVADATLTADEMMIWNGVTKQKGQPCIYDPRLTLVAREHASDLAESLRAPRDDDLDRLRFTLLRLGGTDYALQPLFTNVESDNFESLFHLIEKSRAAFSHCGVGMAGHGSRKNAVWIGVDRMVALNRLPTAVPVGTTVSIAGRLLTEKRAPIQLFAGLPDGRVKKFRPVRPARDGRFQIHVRLGQGGRNEIELLVDVGMGPETAALLPIFVGVSPDQRPVVAPDLRVENDSRPPDRILMSFLNAARERFGLTPLKRDRRLDAVARAHSEDMVAHGFFGHVSPVKGTLNRRLDKPGLAPARSAENLARSPSLYRIHRNLMSSPSHRINTLDPGFTHVGVGVVQDGKNLIVTEIFARF